MSTVDDLVTWLRAQLDDDERVARAAENAWLWNDMVDDNGNAFIERLGIGRWLAEVDAKRRILDLWQQHWERADEPDIDWEEGKVAAHSYSALGDAIRLLALPYADRPGYRHEWRPT